MDRKKKTIAIIASCLVVLMAAALIACNIRFPMRVLQLQPDGTKAVVEIYSRQSILESLLAPGFMGQTYDYEIVVRDDSMFGKEHLRSSFTFANDGAKISDSCISVESEDDAMVITITGSEMSDKVFRVEAG